MRPVVALALVVGIAATPAARQAKPERPQFRAEVEVVEVDVSVLDARRRPVRGLTAADFTIAEDGQPQEIVSFSAIDVPDADAGRRGWLRDVPADVRSNLESADRLLVLVLDDAQVRPLPQHTKAVKDAARAIVDRLSPKDLLAVVFTRDNRGAQPFTNDRQRLLAAVDGFHGEFNPAMTEYFAMGSLVTLRYVAESLYDANQRRKSVIYVSPGVPIDGSGPEMDDRRSEMRRIIEYARRANVNVYALDPSGLGGLDREDGAAGIGGTQGRANDLLHALASNTGGRALANRNDVVGGIGEVFAENASYYLVGYRSTSTSAAGKFRTIDVRVRRDGVTVRARSGYTKATVEGSRSGNGPSAGLVKALREAAPKGDLAMQMTAVPFAGAARNAPSAVAVAIALRQPLASATRQTEQIDLVVGAYEPDGTRRAFERLNARIVFRPTGDGFVRYEILTGLQLRPGRYQLRVASESALARKEGSLHYDLVVPDFGKGDVVLSGVAVSAEPNVPSAGRERIAAILPVVPTSRREFWASDRVSAFVRVHKNRKGTEPVELTTRLRDADERTVFESRDAVSADRFVDGRAVDHRITLPLDSLAAGPYLLTIDASLGKTTVRRDVRFVRR